ncbi:MAG: type II toxin-antitoxin system VapB family antitoxin [Bacteroidia bacterium]|nr:type II toxin-antitoxin system VapB family antitoxin [Bacteroidia bacterium]
MKTTRTNIELRDDLIKDIMRFGEIKTKREAVEKALEMYANWVKRQKLRSLRGKIEWEGDLMKMREGR